MVSVQSALAWQLSVPSTHSLTSAVSKVARTHYHNIVAAQLYITRIKGQVLTHAKCPVLQVASSTDTVIAAGYVDAVGVCKTDALLALTAFINVCV